jgi:hypothetical protein
MKTQTQLSYTDAAMECARYIFDSDCEQLSYEEYIVDENDPRDHILYHAAVVLNETDKFQTDIDQYLKIEND